MMSEDRESKSDRMRAEYDFRGGVRGKHYEDYRQGHTVKVQREDGTVDVHYFTLEEGAVLLEPDVRQYFPDSESVNKALRTLIDLVPAKSKALAEMQDDYKTNSE